MRAPGRGSVGDIAETPAPGEFDLVLIAFNTLYALLTQERQLACVAHAARGLAPDGRFVVEAFVPRPHRYDERGTSDAGDPDDGYARLVVSAHDGPTQLIAARQATPGPSGLRLLPMRIRYVWPTELDLARLCGLRLVHRYGGWEGEPFTGSSTSHVSVYARGDTDTGARDPDGAWQ